MEEEKAGVEAAMNSRLEQERQAGLQVWHHSHACLASDKPGVKVWISQGGGHDCWDLLPFSRVVKHGSNDVQCLPTQLRHVSCKLPEPNRVDNQVRV